MLDSWFMTLGKTQIGPTLGFLPNKFFHKFPCHFHCRELLECCFTLSITWTPFPNPHPSFQGPLPSGFCYQRLEEGLLLKKQFTPVINSTLPWNASFFCFVFCFKQHFFLYILCLISPLFQFSNSSLLFLTLVNLFGEPYLYLRA